MSDKKKVSMQEVSRLSGVSIATVSRVIHNNGRFSEETAKRVHEVMEKLNYTPDALAQGMRKRSIPVVGIIVPDILDDRFGLMVRVVQEKLFESGYTTVVFNSNGNGMQSQRFIDNMVSSHVSGLIYVPDRENTEVNLKGLPTVFFERDPGFTPETPHTKVFMNDYEAAKSAMKEVVVTGKRKILILGDVLGISSYQNRMNGAVDAINEMESSECIYQVLKLEPQRTKATILALNELFEEGSDFDVIFSVSIRMTLGALSFLKDKNLKNQIMLVGIGEHRLHEYGLLDYYALREPLEEMAAAAAQYIVDLIVNKESGEISNVPFIIRNVSLKTSG